MLRDLRKSLRDQKRNGQAAADPPLAAPPSTDAAQPLVAQVSLPKRQPPAELPRPDALAARIEQARAALPGLANSLQRLDLWQQTAATTPATRAVVRAQVGSGKTAVLAHRVLWLHMVQGIALEQMAVTTFTTRAAAQLVDRLIHLLPEPPAAGAFRLFGTLHAVARTLLQSDLDLQGSGWQPGFGVLDEAGSLEMLQTLVRQHSLDVKFPAQWLSRLDGLALGKPVRRGNMRSDDDLQQLAERFAAERRLTNVMNFDDLICQAGAAMATSLAPLLGAVVVDELQDCAPGEVRLVQALAQRSSQFFAVGDPNQSIYGWRGSNPRVFDELTTSLQCDTFDLPNNYRSTPEILAAAQAALGQIGQGSALNSTRATGTKVLVIQHHTPQHEAMYLARRFAQLNQGGVRWSQLAVLARTRRQLAVIREHLQQQGVPCAEPPSGGWRDRPAAAWLLRLLDSAIDTDPQRLRDVLLDNRYGFGTAKLLGKPKPVGIEPTESAAQFWIQHLRAQPGTPGSQLQRQRTEVVAFLQTLLQLQWPMHGDPVADLGLLPRLRPTHRDHARDLRDVRQALQQLMLTSEVQPDRRAALHTLQADGPQALGDQEGVQLLTLHAAKGLEFEHVVLSGCNQGIIPLAAAYADRDALDEERRLLFVGLSRARDSVEISWHMQPAMGQGMPMPSEWLLAMPAAACQFSDRAEALLPAPLPQTQPCTAEWPAGTAVRHAKYGPGAVLRSDASEVVVHFGKFGEKPFALLLCPLQKVPE